MPAPHLLDPLRTAALAHLPADRADELARNLASCDLEDLTYAAIFGAVRRRQEHFALPIEDPCPLVADLWRAARGRK